MQIHLAVTPAGRLVVVDSNLNEGALLTTSPDVDSDDRLQRRIAQLFASSQAEGLFALAAGRSGRLEPSFTYWRDFSGHYLTQLCHLPQMTGAPTEAIPPPASEELADMLLNVPPMQGAEYLTAGVLSDIWVDLDNCVRSEATNHRDGLAIFLPERAMSSRSRSRAGRSPVRFGARRGVLTWNCSVTTQTVYRAAAPTSETDPSAI